MIESLLILLSGSVVIIAVKFAVMWIERRKLPPGPTPIPFIGNLTPKDVHPTLVNWHKELRAKYGDVFTVYQDSQPIIFINGFKAYEEIFKKNGSAFSLRYSGIGVLSFLHDNAGLVWNNETYKIQTRMCIDVMKRFVDNSAKDSRVDEMIKGLSAHSGKPLDIKEYLNKVVSEKLYSLLLSEENLSQADMDKMMEVHYRALFLCGHGDLVVRHPILKYLPGDIFKWRQFLKAKQYLQEFFQEKLTMARTSGLSDDTNSIVDAYVHHIDRNTSKLIDKDFVATSMQLLLAGLETIHGLVVWVLLYLTIRQDVQQKVYEEMRSALGNDPVSWSDNEKLPYMMAVMYEVLRLSDIAFTSLPYHVTRTVTYEGITIPAGSCVTLNLVSVHKENNSFENPEEFIPERFLNTEGELDVPPYFQPFNSGRRMCIGNMYARAVSFNTLTNIIQKFRLDKVDTESYDMQKMNHFLSIPKNFKVICTSRADMEKSHKEP